MTKPEVKLIGEDGNAFYILGAVQKALRKADYDKEKIDAIMEEMRESDYDHLLQTAMKHCEVV